MPIDSVATAKEELRRAMREYRRLLDPQKKKRMDEALARRVLSLKEYREASLLLVYLATEGEPDTAAVIRRALSDGKTAAAPFCVPGSRELRFYRVDSPDELRPGRYGIPEPRPDGDKLIPDGCGGLCLTPGLCYDENGNRLGRGKGYYDRFLARFRGTAIGLCYDECIRRDLPRGETDVPTRLVVTDRRIIRADRQKGDPAWEENPNGAR